MEITTWLRGVMGTLTETGRRGEETGRTSVI